MTGKKHYEHQGNLGCDGKKRKEMDRLKEEKQTHACLLARTSMHGVVYVALTPVAYKCNNYRKQQGTATVNTDT
jgi:hypothetical protein